MDTKDQDDLEDNLAHDGLSEVEGPVHHHGPKLDQDHDQERSRDLILRQGRGDVCSRVFLEGIKINFNSDGIFVSWFEADSQTYTKRPESKHDDDEVDCVSEEHQHVDVCDGAVVRVDQVIEKLSDGKVDLHEPVMKRNIHIIQQILS